MSRMYSAGQFEFNYPPHHLGNWQAQDSQQIQQPPSAKDTHTQQWQATGFIVDDRGHMLPGVKKIKNSFRTRLPTSASSPCRWPKVSCWLQQVQLSPCLLRNQAREKCGALQDFRQYYSTSHCSS
eukprot:GHRQ01036023.1.p2 GENE.GHRQ01036023.1~~GHRQ01036023.1.p2  ORF type:complete len:125 (+),score=22.67 GHRQ01036023.1:398-772(+)